MTALVDFHCHLDLYPDLEAAVREADAHSVYTLAVTTTPRAWPRNFELAQRTKHVRAALGMHPQLVAEHSHELPAWERHLPQAKYVGEVGLDAGPRFYRSFDLQKKIFEHVLRACAEAGSKILTVHSVRAAKHVLDMIETNLPHDRGQVVMHWFTGSVAEARRAASMGCYFSINAEMIASDRGQLLVKSLPKDRLLTETDGPFTRVEDRPTRPRDVIKAVCALAALFGHTEDEMRSIVAANLRALTERDVSG